ncbi:hypothetical protein I2I11_13240 [Pontibacter sp. 172403-2]|uniref:hypothetical protein n=1 Tax=Pontibacter rufus TaxID=2791028 RepID=UPI0018AF95BC|nr:hypothetical protein [Pontibacter sp. 172403-2]MBF9254263.1 hypothetical protein [Pontibacter sp. 172403-2]
MHKLHNILKYASVVCLGLSLLGCEGRRQVEGNGDVTDKDPVVTTDERADTAKLIVTGKTADDQLEEFRGWLNEQVDKGDEAIREDWPETREKLRQRNAELEQKFDSLSAEGKEEYRQLQDRYARWEARQERRQQQPLRPQQLKQWKRQLLDEYENIDDISAANIREAYLTFMGEVRTKRRSWSQDDWDYVDNVYGQLNQRRRQVEGEISTADNIKIRTLQAEYLTLESAADTKSILRETN